MKKLLYTTAILFLCFSMHSLVVGLSGFEIREGEVGESKQFNSLIFSYLRDNSPTERLRFSSLAHLGQVTSLVEAEDLSYLSSFDYVLYGIITREASYYEGSFYLYSREKGEVVLRVYGREGESLESFTTVIGEKLLTRLVEYFELPANTEERRDLELFDAIYLQGGTGYFLPFSPWLDSMVGVVTPVETGIYFGVVPLREINSFLTFRLRFGQTSSYSLGLSRPGLVRTYFHHIRFNFPLLLYLSFYDRYNIFFEFSPAVQLDVLSQVESYKGVSVAGSAAFSLVFGSGFEYWPGKKRQVGIGLKTSFSVTFYQDVWGDFRPQIYVIGRINLNRGGEHE